MPVVLDSSTDAPDPPRGKIVNKSTTTATNNIGSTEVPLTDLTDTFTIPAGEDRAVTALANVRVQATAVPTTVDVYVDVTDSSSVTTRITAASIPLTVAAGAGAISVIAFGAQDLAPGTYTATAKVKRTNGSGSVTAAQPTGSKQSLVLVDVGPA